MYGPLILLMMRLRLHAHDDFDHLGSTHQWRCRLRLLQLREFAWQFTDVYFGDSATAPTKINLQLLRLRDDARQLVGNYFNYSVAHRRLRPVFTSHRLVLRVPTNGVLRSNIQFGLCLLVID